LTRLPSLIYAKALLQTYRLLYPDIVQDMRREEIEEFVKSQYESLVTEFVERNFDIIPQEVRATLELSLYDVAGNGVVKKEGMRVLREVCGFDGELILSGRAFISPLSIAGCEKRLNKHVGDILTEKKRTMVEEVASSP
jgi:hypothetical protein